MEVIALRRAQPGLRQDQQRRHRRLREGARNCARKPVRPRSAPRGVDGNRLHEESEVHPITAPTSCLGAPAAAHDDRRAALGLPATRHPRRDDSSLGIASTSAAELARHADGVLLPRARRRSPRVDFTVPPVAFRRPAPPPGPAAPMPRVKQRPVKIRIIARFMVTFSEGTARQRDLVTNLQFGRSDRDLTMNRAEKFRR